MGNNKALIAAIISAVQAYMKAEEEAGSGAVPDYSRRNSLWSLAGRQEIMSQRKLWQLKIYNGHQLQRSSFLKTGLDPGLAQPRGKSPILLSANE